MDMDVHYMLDDRHQVVIAPSFSAWAAWYTSANRRVARTILPDGNEVSTVFLARDHNLTGYGPPLLFETMVFPPGQLNDLDCERYATWEEAEGGHLAMVEKWSHREQGTDAS